MDNNNYQNNQNYNPQNTYYDPYAQTGVQPSYDQSAYGQPMYEQAGADQNAYYQYYPNQGQYPNAMPVQNPDQQKKKGSAAKVVVISAISLVVVAAITVAVLFLTGVIGGTKYDGTYKFESLNKNGKDYTVNELKDYYDVDGIYELYKVKTGGQEYTLSDLSEQYGMDVSTFFEFELRILEDNCTVTMYGETMEGTVEKNETSVTITIDGESLDCPYNKADHTITMDIDGEAIVLQKQIGSSYSNVEELENMTLVIEKDSYTIKTDSQKETGTIEESDGALSFKGDNGHTYKAVYDKEKQTITVEDPDSGYKSTLKRQD